MPKGGDEDMTTQLTPSDINPKLAPGWTCTQVSTAQPGIVRLQLAHGPDPDTTWFDGWRYSVESSQLDDALSQAIEITHKYTPAHLRIKERLQSDLAAILQQHTVAEWLDALESYAEQIARDADRFSMAELYGQWHVLQDCLAKARIQAERIIV